MFLDSLLKKLSKNITEMNMKAFLLDKNTQLSYIKDSISSMPLWWDKNSIHMLVTLLEHVWVKDKETGKRSLVERYALKDI